MKITIQIAVQSIRETIHALKLERGMSDIITMTNNLIDLPVNARTGTDMKVVGENMGGHRP